ncbi:hypothetical protein Bbelb_051280 [Branchiostoma belcheri]|nr:hypothetical protein Bbelb_051280 [Branchiostoma belcheri]
MPEFRLVVRRVHFTEPVWLTFVGSWSERDTNVATFGDLESVSGNISYFVYGSFTSAHNESVTSQIIPCLKDGEERWEDRWEPASLLRKGYGTTKSYFDDTRFTLSVHCLRFFIHTKQRLTSAMHVSHLCHEKLCLNIEHLSYQPATQEQEESGTPLQTPEQNQDEEAEENMCSVGEWVKVQQNGTTVAKATFCYAREGMASLIMKIAVNDQAVSGVQGGRSGMARAKETASAKARTMAGGVFSKVEMGQSSTEGEVNRDSNRLYAIIGWGCEGGGVKGAIYERIYNPTLNRKGGLRIELSSTWDPALPQPKGQ